VDFLLVHYLEAGTLQIAEGMLEHIERCSTRRQDHQARPPPLERPKEAVKLRLDHNVLAAYRKTGSGWQTRINADLRKAARKFAG
jgi:uncharacterized protein (DUF4415 family)